VKIPSSVEIIGKGCFSRCKSLCEMTFETGCEAREIGDWAFQESNVKKIEIPEKCEILNGSSLVGIESVTICRGNSFFILENNVMYSKDGKRLIRYFGGGNEFTIKKNVEIIGKECFSHCESLCEVRFETGCKVREIGRSAFCRSGLKSVKIPSSVEILGKSCFYWCKSLCVITFESG
jgi:hypothetical protein